MKKIEIFQEHSIEDLKDSVNIFLNSFSNIKVTNLDFTESDYNYKMVILYEEEE